MTNKPPNNHSNHYDIVIVGGGLAGLTCAIHLSRFKYSILLIEKHAYPRHKVCGEYVSNEVLPYLNYLGIDPINAGAKRIVNFELSTVNGNLIKSGLPMGGFGISRYKLDNMLAEKAIKAGSLILTDSVTNIKFLETDNFSVTTKSHNGFSAKIVIGAYGKRASLDKVLSRSFMVEKSPFVAVKDHIIGDMPDDLVGLHLFDGGYCGVSKIENDNINFCYITSYDAFKKYNDIEEFEKNVLQKNQYLRVICQSSKKVFKKSLTISQVSFAKKEPVEQHIIMVGDTAGLIHPLCGNGMSMAIRSAQMASNLVQRYLSGSTGSRSLLEKSYQSAWNKEFKFRLQVGRLLAMLFRLKLTSEFIMFLLRLSPGLVAKIIRFTHGKPMRPE